MNARFVAAVLVAVVVGLAGCATPQKPPQQIGGPSSSPVATATSAATPTAPVSTTWTPPALPQPTLPEVANLQTSEGAAAFVSYWYDQVNYAMATGDTRGVISESHPKCVECVELVDKTEALYESGGHQEGGQFVVTVSKAPTPDADGISIVEVIEARQPGTTVLAEGQEREVVTVRRPLGVVVIFIDDRWFLGGLGQVDNG